ncbi:pilus assembly protein [Rhodobacter sp. NTK016B]|uniref:TadE/TadG family type IV pilus assembly protein n=1 Tax=Rhodobacter sp. NTK016B TaxID=2759676 RepID=UPI001A8E6FE4|nr:TadE/TadG family type IV pilus assembly protein [Rhodobacter sp. NTK016B]MBN8291497.1 pilus assembly protein [Rhodobacter sp. NTK016B]
MQNDDGFFRYLLRQVVEKGRDQSGSTTVEFVVLLPFLIGVLGLVVTSSLYLALASDVQQLAHELARASLSVEHDDDWCEEIEARMVAPLAANLPLLEPDRVNGIACDNDPDTRMLRVSVVYDTRGTLGAILGSMIGLQFQSFQRASFVQW